MTHRLYYTDSYLRDFEAAVVDRADNGHRVYLDRTAFYPTSGGQPFDTGQLGGAEVTDVVDEGERIAHILKTPLSGAKAVGRLNWGRRFDHMQQHTGQHLLSAVLADLLSYPTVGVHFSRETSTLDLDAGGLTGEQVTMIEARANEIVAENRPVQVSFEEATAAATGLRKPSDRAGTLRIVTIHELDRSACGGTHVSATGEIGAILIGKVERVRKGVRLEFLCGGRAIRRARADHDLLGRMAAQMSASPEELPTLLEVQRNDLKEANAGRRALQGELDSYRARDLYAAAVPDATGIRRVVVREAASIEVIRGLAQAFTSMPKAVLIGTVPSPPGVVLAASPDSGIDAAAVLKSLLSSVGGRGGGSATMAQGIVPGRAQLETVVGSISGG